MSIRHFIEKSKFSHGLAIFLLLGSLLVGVFKLITLEKAREPIKIEENQYLTPGAMGGMYLGSKKSHKYFYPWCVTALKLLVADQVWFSSREEAESRGYVIGRCEGLK